MRLPTALLLAIAACAPEEEPAPADVELIDEDGDGWAHGPDCDDGNSAIHPGAPEACDGVDEDCDGVEDDAPIDGITAWADADADGWGDADAPGVVCAVVYGWSETPGDCDDTASAANPSRVETCATELDDDCDGAVNEADALGCGPYHEDLDGDGVGTWRSYCLCAPEGSYGATEPGDCDDLDARRIADCGLSGHGTLEDEAVWIVGADYGDQAGTAVASGGDTDGDGTTDLLIAAAGDGGAVSLLRGPFPQDRDLIAAELVVTNAGVDANGKIAGGADLTGDGLADLVTLGNISAPTVAVFSGAWSGEALVGQDEWASLALSHGLGGYEALAVGDVDGDGAADLLVGDPIVDRVSVMRGPIARGETAATWTFFTETRDCAGYAVLAGRDLDGDGAADVLVSDPCEGANDGGLFLFAGPVDGDRVESDATALLAPADESGVSVSQLGLRLAHAGDLDGDGHLDVAASAGGYDVGDETARWLLYRGPLGAGTDLSAPHGALVAAEDDGKGVADGLGDVDGDGRDDLIVGARLDDSVSSGGGLAAVVLGPAEGVLALDRADGLHRSTAADAWVGWAVAGVGDVDGDGVPDALVGAPGLDVPERDAGVVFLVPGAP